MERTISAYMYLQAKNMATGSFETIEHDHPEILDQSILSDAIAVYQREVGDASMWVGLFDDLRDNPEHYVNGLYGFLDLERRTIPRALRPRLARSHFAIPRCCLNCTVGIGVSETCSWGATARASEALPACSVAPLHVEGIETSSTGLLDGSRRSRASVQGRR